LFPPLPHHFVKCHSKGADIQEWQFSASSKIFKAALHRTVWLLGWMVSSYQKERQNYTKTHGQTSASGGMTEPLLRTNRLSWMLLHLLESVYETLTRIYKENTTSQILRFSLAV